MSADFKVTSTCTPFTGSNFSAGTTALTSAAQPALAPQRERRGGKTKRERRSKEGTNLAR